MTAVILIDVGAGLGRFVSSGSLVFTVAAVLVVGGVASLPLTIGEEYGWRGYLLPRLLPLGEMKATVILAAIWGIWHMPILLIGLNYPGQPLWAVLPAFIAAVALTAFPFTWLYVGSAGSVLIVAVMYSVLNALGDTFTSSRYIPGWQSAHRWRWRIVGTGILLVLVEVWSRLRRERVLVMYEPESSRGTSSD